MGARSNRGWIWFFVILAVLTVASITTLTVYNLRQQLRPEQLAQARALWKEKGPRSYDLEYTVTGIMTGTFQVRVREGKVVYAEPDERELKEKAPYYGMPALFGFIEDYLEEDAKPGKPRTFTVAVFAREDGHLIRYVRRVMGTKERVEINVRLTPVGEDKKPEG